MGGQARRLRQLRGAARGRHAVLHLENVLTELHAVTIREGLVFPNYFYTWHDGRPGDPNATSYAKVMLDQLTWWATALRKARAEVPTRRVTLPG